MSGSGTTTIFNANTYSGGTFVTAGTLVFASGGSVASTSGTSTFNVSGGATLTFQAGSELVTGSIGLADNGTVNLNNPAVTLSALTGTGVLNLNTTALSISSGGYTGTINGTGSVIINTSMNFGGIGIFNTYSGGTTINGSSGTQVVVTVGSNGAFGTGPVVFSNAALQTHHHHRVAADDHGRQSNRQQLLVRVGRHRPLPRRRPDRPGRQRHPSGRGSPPSALPAPPRSWAGRCPTDRPGRRRWSRSAPARWCWPATTAPTPAGATSRSARWSWPATTPSAGPPSSRRAPPCSSTRPPGWAPAPPARSTSPPAARWSSSTTAGSAGLAGSTPVPTTISGNGITTVDTYGALRGADGQSAAYAGNIIIAPGGAAISGGANNGTLTVSGVISNSPASTSPALDPVAFSRANNSTTVLTGNSTYTGETQMIPNPNVYSFGQSVGTLRLGTSNAINPASGFNMVTSTSLAGNYDGLTLDLNGYSQSFAYLTGGFHTNSGSTMSNYLIINNGNTPSVLTINNGNATVAGTGFMAAVGPQVFADNIQDGSNTITLVKSGPGTEILSGTNSYSGGTTVAGGTLQASSPSALGTSGQGTITMAGGTLFLAVPQTTVSIPVLSGFRGFTANNTTSSVPTINSAATATAPAYGVATLTTKGANLSANSVFSSLTAVSPAQGFGASFTYNDSSPYTSTFGSSGGFAFVIQDSKQTAVGTSGAGDGYSASPPRSTSRSPTPAPQPSAAPA